MRLQGTLAGGLRLCDGCHLLLATHAVLHGGEDTGFRRCCLCMDELMVKLADIETANGGDGPAGLASFRAAHDEQCVARQGAPRDPA